MERSALAPRSLDPIGISSDVPDAVPLAQPLVDLVQLARDELSGHGAAAVQAVRERAALLMGPDNELERMARDEVRHAQRTDGFDGGQRSEIAVEVSSLRHRIDVRPEQDRTQAGVLTRAGREDVAGRIDARRESDLAHEIHDVSPPGDVGVRIGDAADAVRESSPVRAAERAQRLDLASQAIGVDPRRRRRRRQAAEWQRRGGEAG